MVANLTARGIDVEALDELALDGFKIVADSRELLSDIARTNRLDLPLPPNNAFFYWQMSQRHCAAGATAKCNGRRWDDYLDSEVIRKLKAELRLVVMQYLSSVGIDGADVPEFEVRTWANVQSAVSPRPLADDFSRWAASPKRPGRLQTTFIGGLRPHADCAQETEPLGIHEHTSKGYCVASGTFYSAIPHKSGALRFHDSRGRMTEDMKRLQVL